MAAADDEHPPDVEDLIDELEELADDLESEAPRGHVEETIRTAWCLRDAVRRPPRELTDNG